MIFLHKSNHFNDLIVKFYVFYFYAFTGPLKMTSEEANKSGEAIVLDKEDSTFYTDGAQYWKVSVKLLRHIR